ncbi:MAG: Asp-tRNA(Asn)/Glu-tRNA(Gln) amidotransferase subunit GatB [Candidatus Magasanikbacteria bacterium]|nr:Asp-tRNA(Asn)/Glu-tRNA(Gln) amidotransferase subunit GatB [Candidatus Magasanikbacteria bacterium]
MYSPVIGLEIHIQLKTKSKMFCACDNAGEFLPPNTAICPVCTGQPGTLPSPNARAIEWAVKAALALNCQINPHSKFDRKHYFYPDLPKGYQISQHDLPIGEHGYLEIETENAEGKIIKEKISIIRLHLEEDAAKNIHANGATFVDFNRAGTPLMEIVTTPEIKTPRTAKTFLTELQVLARFLHISSADMEKGHLRCDVNISLRPEGDSKFYPKTEIKNLNSFRAVERALEYEIKRQTKLWDQGAMPDKTTTRGWNDIKGVTEEQRVKEGMEDYRYFPEPDIPALNLKKITEKARREMPELPQKTRARFMEEYGLSRSDARLLTNEPAWAEFTENVFNELWVWLKSLPEMEGTEEEIMAKNRAKAARLVGGWLTSKLMGLMAENKVDIKILKITPENFAEFITLIYTNKINGANALLLLEKMMEAGGDPSIIMEEKSWGQVRDADIIERAAETVIRLNPEQVAQYKKGKAPVLQFLIGKMMKETRGQVDPQTAKKMLEEKLK